MRQTCRWIVLGVLLGAVSVAATAQHATQGVTIIVEEVNNLSVAADVSMALSSAPEHPAPEADAVATATYAFSTNGYGKKITGQLGAGFTADLALDVALAAPTASGSSTGSRTLDSANAVDLVTGISRVTQSGLGVNYSVSPTDDARSSSEQGGSQTVTFTVTDR
ncbi:MAG: hypothetical protein ABJF88_03215 [Rhodothermales bacterium]